MIKRGRGKKEEKGKGKEEEKKGGEGKEEEKKGPGVLRRVYHTRQCCT